MSVLSKQMVRKISEARFKPSDFVSKNFTIVVESGTTMEDIMKPEYFCHVAKYLEVGNEIKVMSDDMSLYARLIVLNSTNVSARVFALEYHDLSDAETSVSALGVVTSEDYEVVFRGIHSKWSIVKKDGGQVVIDGLDDRRTAERELAGYLKSMAA